MRRLMQAESARYDVHLQTVSAGRDWLIINVSCGRRWTGFERRLIPTWVGNRLSIYACSHGAFTARRLIWHVLHGGLSSMGHRPLLWLLSRLVSHRYCYLWITGGFRDCYVSDVFVGDDEHVQNFKSKVQKDVNVIPLSYLTKFTRNWTETISICF